MRNDFTGDLLQFFLNHPEVEGFEEFVLGHAAVAEAVAKDARLPVSLIERIAASKLPSRVLSKLSLNPNVSVAALQVLAGKAFKLGEDPEMHAVFLNPRMPEDLLVEAAPVYPLAVIKNPSTPEWLVRSLCDGSSTRNAHAAQNPNLPHDIAWELWRRGDVDMLVRFTKHADILMNVVCDHRTHSRALEHIIKNPAFTKRELLETFDYFPESVPLYQEIARRFAEDEEVLLRLLGKCEHPYACEVVLKYVKELPQYAEYPDEWLVALSAGGVS